MALLAFSACAAGNASIDGGPSLDGGSDATRDAGVDASAGSEDAGGPGPVDGGLGAVLDGEAPDASGDGGSSGFHWDVTVSPPALVSPMIVDVPDEMTPREVGGGYNGNCEGWIQVIRIPEGRDAIVRYTGDHATPYPVLVQGGRNVRVVGFDINLEIQPGCEAGAIEWRGVRNPHPVAPTARAFGVDGEETSFIEGVSIEMNGIESDCIIANSSGPTRREIAEASERRRVVLQNVRCQGYTGSPNYFHGDLLQTQVGVLNSLVLENVTAVTRSEGIIISFRDMYPGARTSLLRRYEYTIDERFVTGDSTIDGPFGLAFIIDPDVNPATNEYVEGTYRFEDVWINDYTRMHSSYGSLYNWRTRATDRIGSFSNDLVSYDPGIHDGAPPMGSFAPRERLGIHYESPHDS